MRFIYLAARDRDIPFAGQCQLGNSLNTFPLPPKPYGSYPFGHYQLSQAGEGAALGLAGIPLRQTASTGYFFYQLAPYHPPSGFCNPSMPVACQHRKGVFLASLPTQVHVMVLSFSLGQPSGGLSSVVICFHLFLSLFICFICFVCFYLLLSAFICLYLFLSVCICFYLFVSVFICFKRLSVFICLRETLCGAHKRIRDAGSNADISSIFIHYWPSIDSLLTLYWHQRTLY